MNPAKPVSDVVVVEFDDNKGKSHGFSYNTNPLPVGGEKIKNCKCNKIHLIILNTHRGAHGVLMDDDNFFNFDSGQYEEMPPDSIGI
ncbi:MAG: hypothetical protein V4439_01565 [Patescibacteria group bacterium]